MPGDIKLNTPCTRTATRLRLATLTVNFDTGCCEIAIVDDLGTGACIVLRNGASVGQCYSDGGFMYITSTTPAGFDDVLTNCTPDIKVNLLDWLLANKLLVVDGKVEKE